MKKKNRNRGFTLVELMVTVVILAIVVAPFLGLFVMASGNNLNASQKQDAANLAEDIAEEIKGKTLAAIEKDPNCKNDGTGGYKIEIENSDLPDGIGKNFRAIATLTPNSSNDINKDMPAFTDISGKDTMLLRKGFYFNDKNYSGAAGRESTITLKYDDANTSEPYHVELNVKYFDSAGKTIGPNNGVVVSKHDYANAPSIFAVYTSMDMFDRLYFKNEVSDSDMRDIDGNMIPVKFFLSVQKVSNTHTPIINDNIKIEDEGMPSAVSIREYIEDYMSGGTDRLYVYTDALGDKSSLVENMQSNKLYDLKVDVEYKTGTGKYKKCASYVTSKLNVS